MGIFFGTDGIRGIVNDSLTFDLAYKCGNALAGLKSNAKIIIGGDTRIHRSFLISAFAGGAMNCGAKIIDVGVCPTAGIAYLTKKLNMDYGTVISASHNSAEFNGIKIFNSHGFKLGDKNEEMLERRFIHEGNGEWEEIGNFVQDFSLVKLYENYLVECCSVNLKGLTILLDGSNGAASRVAPKVFRRLGAKVIATNCSCDGLKINDSCGSLHPETMKKAVMKYKADMGFAFDGDSDRIIACDENGKIIDGDLIIYMLAKFLQKQNKLAFNKVVGTRHTNMGLEMELKKEGVELLRSDIGDKYVIAEMEKEKLSLGGEKSGHIIFREYATTGDGILTGIKIAEMIKILGKKLSKISKVDLYPQCNIDCNVFDKMKIINSEKLSKIIENQESILGDDARIMVRVSGTENKIRIMVECKDMKVAKSSAKEIEKVVYDIDNELGE